MRTEEWFLVGAPWDSSGTGRGEERAPAALRDAGVARLVGTDLGDAVTVIRGTARDPVTGVRALPETLNTARALRDALADAMRALPGRRPLVVGGDCSLLLGVPDALGPVGVSATPRPRASARPRGSRTRAAARGGTWTWTCWTRRASRP